MLQLNYSFRVKFFVSMWLYHLLEAWSQGLFLKLLHEPLAIGYVCLFDVVLDDSLNVTHDIWLSMSRRLFCGNVLLRERWWTPVPQLGVGTASSALASLSSLRECSWKLDRCGASKLPLISLREHQSRLL